MSNISNLSQRRERLSPEQRSRLASRLRGAPRAAGIERQPLPERIPLSCAQRSLWLTWKLDPLSPAYNMPGALTLRGPLQIAAVEAALRALLERHDILRTLYSDAGGEPEQRILPVTPLELTRIDLRTAPAELAGCLHVFAAAPFALDTAPPLRIALYQLAAEEHVLAFALHHIAGDAWSLSILLDEFCRAYSSLARGAAILWQALPIQFADYAVWQHRQLAGATHATALEYWRARLDAAAAPLELPFDRPRGSQSDPSEGRHVLQLPPELSEQLHALQRSQQVSLFMVLLALLKLVLYRCSGQRDLSVGTPLANREDSATHGLIGYLLNVQVVRTQLEVTRGFAALLARVRDAVLDAQAHAQVPFDLLVEALQPERRPGVHPLFQVKCTQLEALPRMRSVGELSAELLEMSSGHAHFDLSCDFTAMPDGIRCEFVYARALFDAATIQRMARTFQSLAAQVVGDVERALASFTVSDAEPEVCGELSSAEDVMLQWWQAARVAPEQVAVRCEDILLDNQQLATQVQRLAGELMARGVGPEVRVAVLAERSCEFVLGVLAVLHAGGAYVPLDAQWPAERLARHLADSGAQLLLASSDVEWEPRVPVLTLTLDAAAAALPAPPAPAHPQQTAYVIYTSGSTGQPKGVAVTRGALASYVHAVLARLELSSEVSSMAMVSTAAADLGHTTFFGALCSGRTLHLISPARAFDPDRFAAYMAREHVDVLKIVPSHLQALLQAEHAADVLPRAALILGGEPTSWSLLERVRGLRACRIFNHYGPTETTVGVLALDAAQADRASATLPLGKPLANARALVLDAELNPVPVGIAGELYLSGASVARGYHGRPGASAERFLAHPCWPGERMYRTGDRVRRRADATFEFLGRADEQIKIRGYRIELGEVRAALLQAPAVRDAAVIARHAQDGRPQLCAYVVGDAAFEIQLLRQQLVARLPDYMLPAAIVVMDALPLTANGKLDRRALPEPVLGSDAGSAAPEGANEILLASIWAEVLRVPRVGRHDGFFELGGDSILALQAVARARKRGLLLVPKQLLELQTIARIAAAAAEPATPAAVPTADTAVLTPIQRWFFAQPLQARHHWNQSVLLTVPPLEIERLDRALRLLVQQHPALRLRFATDAQGEWRPMLDAAARFVTVDLSNHADPVAAVEQTADSAQRGLQLAGPLLSVMWLRLPEAQHRLLLIAHHLVIDIVSWQVLVETLQALYAGAAVAADDRYLEWTQRLQSYANSERCSAQLEYWRAADRPDPRWPASEGANTVGSTRCTHGALSVAQTELLLRHCSRPYRTRIDELLLSALARCLCDWSELDSVRIELEGHGRDQFDDLDLSRSVGWFTSLYPVRLTPAAELRATILAVKEQLRSVPDGGVGYGALRGQLACEQPYLTFNYLGQLTAQADNGWQLACEPRGEERAPGDARRAWFEVIAKVQDGQLHIQWYYSRNLHDGAMIAALLTRYLQGLAAVIEHCAHAAAGALSPADIPLARLSQMELDALQLEAANVEHVYPLAPMQQGLLLHSLLNAGAGMYLMQDQYRLNARLDVPAFQRAWDHVVQRHEVLRTGFVWHGTTTQLQVVYRQVPSVVEFLDFRGLDRDAALERLEGLLEDEIAQGFDLQRPPLLKLRLVQLDAHEFQLVQSFHHVLMDAWCRSLLMADFFAHYQAERSGHTLRQRPPRPYRDFIAWLQRQDVAAARRYWREQLHDVTATPLPWCRELADSGTAAVIDAVELLSSEATAGLQRLAQAQQLTLNTIVQGAWALSLARLSGRSDVLFGVTVAGRPLELEGIQDTVGLFINTIALRIRLPPPHTPVVSWLQDLLAQNLTMRQHEHLPLVEIQAVSGVPRGRNLFDSLFVFENAPLDASVQEHAQALGIRPLSNRTHTNYPLTVVVIPGRELWLQLSCDERRFDASQVTRLLQYFKQVVLQIGAQPQATLAELSGVTSTERHELLQAGSGAHVGYAFARGYAGLFEVQARVHGERIAARCRGAELSYAQLNVAANRIAHGLRHAGIGPDHVVALWGKRGLDLLTLVLGTLKAGGAFLALAESLPPQRIATLLSSSRCQVVAACAVHAATIEGVLASMPAPPRLLLDTQLQAPAEHDLDLAMHPDQPAYVIYTSGSTGEPKGVVITQRGMLNNQLSKLPFLDLDASDVIAQTAAQSFDISVWQLLAGLLCGACIEIVPDEIARDPEALLAQVRSTGITVLQCVPAVIAGMLDTPVEPLPSLRWLLPTGEACSGELARRWLQRHPSIPLVNAYGPAECADDVALHQCALPDPSPALPIGHATDNTHLYVLDAELEPVPTGVAGELYVAGVGVGRGYLHRAGFTAERFIAHPFAAGERLYRTSDLARLRDDGVFEYVGRVDTQVKVRGVRIELGEIEAQLCRLAAVHEAAVHVHPDVAGMAQLVGYVVPRIGTTTPEQLRAELRQFLPEAMVPTLWWLLDRLPRTANGKLDRSALPRPDVRELQADYESPAGTLETTLAAVWSEVLGVERVGRRDNFFALGGHSLLALQVSARLRQRLQIEVPLEWLFATASLQELAERLAALTPTAGDAQLRELDAFLDELEAGLA